MITTKLVAVPAAEPYDYGAEQAVLVVLITAPERIEEASARLVPDDFEGRINRRIFGILTMLHGEGRKPSIEAIVAIVGDDEIAPHTRIRDYLRRMVAERLYGVGVLPLNDMIETVLEASRRRKLAGIAGELQVAAMHGTKAIAAMATEAVAQLDEVLSTVRSQKRRSYDAGIAGRSAIDMLSSECAAYPTTGLVDLDAMLGGWPRGELSVLAGRPGTGKSAVASSVVLKAAKAGHPVAFFSLEMHGAQLGARMLTDLVFTGERPIHYEDILKRRAMNDHDLRRLEGAQAMLERLPIRIEEQRGLSVAEIGARSRKIAAECERNGKCLAMVVVDHMHIVKASDRYAGNRNRELAEISGGLTTIAKDLDVSMLALCQLSRAVEGRENKRPSMPDLRESGAIEEDASVIIFLYRAAYYLEKQRFDNEDDERERIEALERVRNRLELGVDKNRNGRVGIVDAFVDIGANAIRNASFAKS
jgi:replicative DNA helicase